MRLESNSRSTAKVVRGFAGQYLVVEEAGHVVEIVAGPFATEVEAGEVAKLWDKNATLISYPGEWREAV